MTQNPKRREPPVSVRFTPDERARLERAASGMPLSTYIKAKLFDPSSIPERKRRGSEPIKDHKPIAKILAMLGEASVAKNLALLAKTAATGSLTLDPDTTATLRQACKDIARIRALLIKAVGMKQ